MDNATIDARAEAISQQYRDELPEDYANKHSTISDKHTLATLFRGISAGLNQRDCCAAARIHPTTFQRWIALGEDQPGSAHAAFAADVKAARAASKTWHLENIKRHSAKEWTASAWTLERTDPEQFALRKDTDNAPKVVVMIGASQGDVQVSIGQGSTPQVVVAALPEKAGA